jgi:hypothetical protein
MRIRNIEQFKVLTKGTVEGICGQVPDCPILFIKDGCTDMIFSYWRHALKEGLTNKPWNVRVYLPYKDKEGAMDKFLADSIQVIEKEDDENFESCGGGMRQAISSDHWKKHEWLDIEREEIMLYRLMIKGIR